MRPWIGMSLVVLGISGCAFLGGLKADYDVGKSTPLGTEEISARDAANRLVDPVRPFLPGPLLPLAGIAVGLLTTVGLWNRGRRIRKQLPVSSNPITGHFGEKVGLEAIVQHLSNLFAGVFEVGNENSGMRRAWKVGVVVVVSLISLAMTFEPVKAFLLVHPEISAIIIAVSSALAGVEKSLSHVLPLQKPEVPA